MAKSLMVQGTMSNAGKSLITAGLCRILKQDGYKVVPFKSQNMALNSYITKDGFEMGRAQVIQAEACGVEPSVLMNPILLKPTNDVGSQIIVNGEVIGHMSASEYFKHKKKLVPDILKAFNTLSNENDIVVIEGAGSPAEINLKSEDIVNMGMAKMADAPVLLVGDIDRGGVFASLYGTVALLEDDERARIKGLIINKFRGDVEILKPGLKMLENLTGIPVVGVVPYSHLDIEDEDSLAPRLSEEKKKKIIDIAVIRLPRIANFTDFNSLERFPQVSVRYVERHEELHNPDLIILPGTKNTMEDLLWLRQNGLEAKILKLNGSGIPVIGICGGYQMLGEKLCDPNNIEYGGELRGLGMLPVETVFKDNKTRTRVNGKTEKIEGFFSKLSEKDFVGYEIHMGVTSVKGECLSTLDIGSCKAQDGCIKGNVLGSYVHGIFDEGTFAESLVSLLLERKGYTFEQANNINYNDYRMQQYDKLAEVLLSSLDMDKIYSMLNIEKEDL